MRIGGLSPGVTDRPAPVAERLVALAQRRLAGMTLALLVALLTGVGLTTALIAERSLDASIDQTLETAARAAAERAGEGSGEGVAGGDDGSEADEHQPAAADTFFLYLDARGDVVTNPERVPLVGLPDRSAASVAVVAGRDLRTVRAGGVAIRLLTLTVAGGDEGSGQVRAVQAGFVLTLHDEQTQALRSSIILVVLVGLVAAGVITVVLTRRALVPVRDAFDRERRFVAAASHELRTPIALVRSTAEVLTREGLVAQGGQALVSDIVAESDRLARLVSDLSALAVAQARAVPKLVDVDLAAAAAEIARRAQAMAEAEGIELTVAPSGRILVQGTEDQILQIALILIDNAIRHSPPGGTVRLAVDRTSEVGRLTVDDDGPGIPPDERERIFEPFTSLDGTPGARHRAGSGLGLSIARATVTAMGGSVRAGESPGGGARLVVSLPLAKTLRV